MDSKITMTEYQASKKKEKVKYATDKDIQNFLKWLEKHEVVAMLKRLAKK